MRELALFAGAGGGILGGHLLGWRTVCAVEFEPYAASVLAARQNDGLLPPFPIWDDVRTFDGRPWRGLVDVVSGGFPCQDISAAGNGAGIDGERSGLWREMARIVGEVRPRFVFVENSPLLVRRGLAVVLGDLTELGYDARWCVMGAADVGAPHQRDRIWIVAHANGLRELQPTRRKQERRNGAGECCEALAYTGSQRLQSARSKPDGTDWQQGWRVPSASRRWPAEPDVGRVAHGMASRVDRIKALGNGQVPRVAAAAFTYLASDWI
ncbi:TPA: DNA cytosine methyltransferase [Pseudomonas aeruginosa]|nr:DNA cytosine methyltransferase [Pseudomonas aeruginosa]